MLVNVQLAQISTFVIEVCLWYIGFVLVFNGALHYQALLRTLVMVNSGCAPVSTLLSVPSSAWLGLWDTDTISGGHTEVE